MADSRYRLTNCEECGRAYTSARSHSRFCGTKCRMKHMRKGRAKSPGEKCNNVTLSYLEALVTELSPNTPEDWQNE